MVVNLRTQSVCTKSIAANLIMVRVGCAFGWLSLSLPLLQSAATPLKTGAISTEEMSWIGCVAAPGAVLGNFLCGYIVTLIGTRHTLFLVGFPQLIGWLFLTFGTRPIHLVLSRFINGMANGGAQTCVFLFVAELADNKIQGKLGTIFMHGRKIGVLIAFITGSYYNYVTASMYFIGITIVFMVALLFVPSTPQYFLRKNKIEEAQKAFNYYNKHRLETDPKFCVDQFENLKDVPKADKKFESKLTWRDISKARYGLLQTIIFSLLNRLTAHSIFLTYGSAIVAKSGSYLSPEGSSIFMSGVELVSTFFTLQLIVSKGRKFLLILSLVGCAICHAIMIVYVQLNNHYGDRSELQSSLAFHSIPIICMSIAIFVASIGIVPLTFICTAESFTSKVRPFGMTFGNIVLNSFAFLLYKIYPSLEELIGLQACLIIFCISCTLGTIYVAVIVEENKILDLNDDDDDTNEADEADETDESDQPDETTSLRYDMRRLSRQFRQSHHRIQPHELRKYSVVSFA